MPSKEELRFGFGRNWERFVEGTDERHLQAATRSLAESLRQDSLAGRSFLDVGSGSGLFSLAAARLGAERIVSFDYDPRSVDCTAALRASHFADHQGWSVRRGSCLDRSFLSSLGAFDCVYAWGVLHHTGDLWAALRNLFPTVAPGGRLCAAIYNDQGRLSDVWRGIKRAYNASILGRWAVVLVWMPLFALYGGAVDLAHLRGPLRRYREPGPRGMSTVRDWYDWLGGYPFEVASPRRVEACLEAAGMELLRTVTVGRRSGCNEFLARRPDVPGDNP